MSLLETQLDPPAGPPYTLNQAGYEPPSVPADSQMASVAVSCLGTFRCVISGSALERWRPGRARSLFQYLVSHHDRSVPREALLSALWPNPTAAAPRTSLKVAVHALRQTFREVHADQTRLEVLTEGQSYRLSAADLWLDVDEFDRQCNVGRSLEADGNKTGALHCYARAAQLYQGDFLQDEADNWPVFRRESLKDRFLHVLGALAEASVAEGRYHDGILACQQLLAKDSCREQAFRVLMMCHAYLGQRSRVHAWYGLCVTTLAAELGAEPEPDTQETYRRALQVRADTPGV